MDDWTNKEHVLSLVRMDGLQLCWIGNNLSADKEIALAAIWQNPMALEYVADVLLHDRSIVLEAIRLNPKALEFAPKHFKKDKEVVLEAFRVNFRAIEFADNSLKNDKKFIRKLFNDYPSLNLKDNPSFIQKANGTEGLAFSYATELWKRNDDYIYNSLAYCPKVAKYCIRKICTSRRLMHQFLVQGRGRGYVHLPNCFKADKEFVLYVSEILALRKYEYKNHPLVYAPKRFKDDVEFMSKIISQDGKALRHASKRLKDMHDVVEVAISNDINALQFASDRIRTVIGAANPIEYYKAKRNFDKLYNDVVHINQNYPPNSTPKLKLKL